MISKKLACAASFIVPTDHTKLLYSWFYSQKSVFNLNKKSEIFSESEKSGHDRYELQPYLILLFYEALWISKEEALPFLLLKSFPTSCQSIQQ